MENFILSFILIVLMSTFAVADNFDALSAKLFSSNNFYMGVSYGRINVKENDSWEDGYAEVNKVRYDSLMAQAGYQFNKYLAIEGRYWQSVGNNLYTGSNNDDEKWSLYDNEQIKAYGIYAKPIYPLSERIDIYGLAGYGNVKATYGNGGTVSWIDRNDLQLGAGLSYDISGNTSLFVDYVKLLDNSSRNPNKGSEEHTQGSQTDCEDKIFSVNTGVTYKF